MITNVSAGKDLHSHYVKCCHITPQKCLHTRLWAALYIYIVSVTHAMEYRARVKSAYMHNLELGHIIAKNYP